MPSQPSSFHFFPNLPLELRHQIYTLSLSTPRLIPLTVTRASQRKGTRLTYHHTRFHTSPPTPPLLSTTHETRLFALQFYARLFRNPQIITTPHGFVEVHDQPPQLPSEPKLGCDGVWFRSDLDTLCVSDRDLRYVPLLERGLIMRRLELRVRNLQSFEEYHVDDLVDYRGLRELAVVVEGLEEGNWMDERNVEHMRSGLERIKKDFGLKCDISMRVEEARRDGG